MRKSLVSKVLAIAIIAFVWLAAAEVLVRVLIPLTPMDKAKFASIFAQSRDSELSYEMKPNFTEQLSHLTEEKITYQTNRQGFRDRDFLLPKTDGRLRVAVVGDSITFGIGVQEEDTYPRILERQLRGLGLDIEVMNFGIGGYNTLQEWELLKTRVLPYKPSLVILGYALNDADRYADWTFDESAGRLVLKNTPKSTSNYRGPLGGRFALIGKYFDQSRLYWLSRRVVDRIANSNPSLGDADEIGRLEKTYTASNETWDERKGYLSNMAEMARENGAGFLVVILPLAYQFEYPRSSWIMQTAIGKYLEENSLHAVDLLKPMEESQLKPGELFVDSGHFTRLGNFLAAQSLVEALFRFRLIE